LFLNKATTKIQMKRQIAKLSIFILCAAGLLASPALSRAQDTASNAPAAKEKKAKTEKPKNEKNQNGAHQFKGDLKAVDANAMTLSVGDLTLQVTSETKITKDGKPAQLADGVAGQPVSGTYKKSEEGKMNAETVHFGAKSGGKKKKLSEDATKAGNN
jgi:hypothetical protein